MAATSNAAKKFRSWNYEDSFEESDIVRLFDTERVRVTRSAKCLKYWTVYCTLLSCLLLFFLGILIGFLLRADPQVDDSCWTRKDGFDKEKLQAVHNNILYLMTEDNIGKIYRELSGIYAGEWSTESLDKVSAEYVQRQFQKLGFDKVEIEEHEIVVTSPDPENPNRLEILSSDGGSKKNITFSNSYGSKFEKSRQPVARPYVAFSPAGSVMGPVLYGNYGQKSDFLQLQADHELLKGAIVLLKLGITSVADKVKLAEMYGCAGVILFCNHGDSCCHGNCDDFIPVASTVDFTDLDEIEIPTIPVQTVSYNDAQQLFDNLNGTELPSAQQQRPKTSIYNTGDGKVRAKLEVNNNKVHRTIFNVIATLFGSEQSDRQILLGSRRLREPGSFSTFDPASSTGVLLELGRSMTYIKDRELWRPRRTIKFISYGGDLPYIGLYQYFKSQRHLLYQEGVAYLDTELGLDLGTRMIQFKTSPSLINLISKVVQMIPDPQNPEYSLAEDFPESSHDWFSSNQSIVNMYSSTDNQILHQLGISSLSLQHPTSEYSQITSMSSSKDEVTYHIQHDLTTARVFSLTTLKLADDFILPFNFSFVSQFIYQALNKSLTALEVNISRNSIKSDDILEMWLKLSYQVERLQAATSECTKVPQINDFIMRFDTILQKYRSRTSLWTVDSTTGMLSSLSEAMEEYTVTGDAAAVNSKLSDIRDILTEALQGLDSVGIR